MIEFLSTESGQQLLQAVILLMGAATTYLTLRSRTRRT